MTSENGVNDDGSNGGGGGGVGNRFASWTSFGSVTQDSTSQVRLAVWNESVAEARFLSSGVLVAL